MEKPNQTSPLVGFILLGLSAHPKLEKMFFVLILLTYVVILLGNGVLILVTILDSRLHTPMYFFLGMSDAYMQMTLTTKMANPWPVSK